ncbi:hydroxyethylthiazole kinase [Candidatus Omnitrophota bacterium]
MDIYGILQKLRTEKPLVHHLTNWVTIYDCANIVKVFGAAPVMAHAAEEVEDMASLASSLVLNIGTLTTEFIQSMKLAAKSANKKGIPVILDVCGAGATKLRDRKSFELLDAARIDIIKGNASEVARIAGEKVQTKGVDASKVEKDLIELARYLAEKRDATVVITGKEDIVAGKDRHFVVKNGCDMMAHVVGTGCMASSVIGAFSAVEKDLPKAATAGLVCYEIAAELACKDSSGPGTFKESLFDNVYNLNKEKIEKLKRIE